MRRVVVLLGVMVCSSFIFQTVLAEADNTMTNLPIATTSDTLEITIRTDNSISQDKINAVKDAILSTNTLHIGGKNYFKGWQGALNEASNHHTKHTMPTKLEITDSIKDNQGIIITLTTSQSPSDLTGLTTFDINGLEITNIKILIFNANDLTDQQLKAITRHEFGHALGLAHSTSPGNLMNAQIHMGTAFVSYVNIDALTALYDGMIKKLYVEGNPE